MSDLFNKLNGEAFLNNSFYISNETWNNYIVSVDWKYGFTSNQVAWYDINGNYGKDGDAVYLAEQKWKDSVNAKIGIMYISDYYYVIENNNNGWIDIVNNDNLIDMEKNENDEFFINKKNTEGAIEWRCENLIWTTSAQSCFDDNKYVRPTFYLTNSIKISGGTGSIDNPFIINNK